MTRGRRCKGPFATDRFELTWEAEPGAAPRTHPKPSPQDGVGLDMALTAYVACALELPFPAAGRGHWRVVCLRCRINLRLPTTGRIDDPATLRLPCRLHQ